MLYSLPNLLTLSRIFAILPITAMFYLEGDLWRWISFGLYCVAGMTDYFDGLLARSTGSVSKIGRFLDPIADKLMVAAIIVMLIATDRLSGYAVLAGLIIVIREIAVSGLREFLAEAKVGVPVSNLAKWKTMIQIFALGFLLVGEASPAAIPSETIGEILLWIAAGLTVITGYDYLRVGVRHMTS